MLSKSRRETDWFAELKDDEIEKDEKSGKTLVLLKGLRRLAVLAGKVKEKVVFGNAFICKNGYFAQIGYEIEFDDGSIFCGVGDTNPENGDVLWMYPSAVAESRAEARALKKALSLFNVLAKEEIGSSIDLEDRRITNEQKIMLEKVAKERDMPHIEIIKNASNRKGVTSLEDLTYEEGQKAAIFVNKYGRKTK